MTSFRSDGRAALYHRVSTNDQNPDAARIALRDAAQRFGLRVVLEIEETGSGANNDRPGLVRVLEAARRGQLDAILVWKLDRFGRSALDLLANLRQLENSGVRFVAVTQGLDIHPGGDALSRLMLTMLAAIAEFERNLIRERTKLGIERARRAGKQIGRPRTTRPPAEQVRALKTAGRTWQQIADELGCTVCGVRQAAKTGAQHEGSQPRGITRPETPRIEL